MNNLDWLYTMQPRDLAKWFKAEHVEPNDDLPTEKGVRTASVDSNDANAAQDSREKLEADLKTLLYEFGGYCFSSREGHTDNVDTFFEDFVFLLDRQTAITEEKTRCKWVTASAEEIAAWRSKAEKLKEQVYELTAERDQWRALCGKMMDAAHEITVLGEGFE